MLKSYLLGIALAVLALAAKPAPPCAAAPRKGHLLYLTLSAGFKHDSVPLSRDIVTQIGKDSEAFDVTLADDVSPFTEANLKNYDAVMFYTTGDLGLNDEQKSALLSFVKDDGKGFLGTHSATDTYYDWPAYGEMIGAYFNEHPWGQVHAEIVVEDRTFPATKQFAAHFPIYDELYQFKDPYSRDKLRVLMSIDPKSVDLTNPRVHRTDQDFAVTWVHQYGKGRVFYSSLGHREEVWDRPDIQQMWIEGVKWAMGLTKGDATPRPKSTN